MHIKNFKTESSTRKERNISSVGDDKGDEPSRGTREPRPSMLAYVQVTGIKQRVGKPSKELKNAIKYTKIGDPPICNDEDHKWRNST